jgi:hypothetical protein
LRFRSGGALTAWINSWLRGGVSYDAAVAAINAAGISVIGGLPGHDEPVPVGWVFSALRSPGGTPLRLVLPVPGDIRGVPSIPGLAAAAARVGQLVIGSGLGMLPDDPEMGGTSWRVWEVADPGICPATPGEQQTVPQAAGALRLAVLQATDALAALDVARWNREVPALRRREQPISLPPDHDPAAAALAHRGAQLTAVLELAAADAPGGAITAFGAGHRHAALQPLAVAVREALMTAFSAISAGRTVDR